MENQLEIKRKIFCDTLKTIRKDQCHIKQKILAKRLGVTQSYISKIEKGSRGIDIIELIEYCHAMRISLTEFSARLEWKLGELFPEDSTHMKYFLSVLRSFSLTEVP